MGFQFIEEDFERYVTKKEHGNVHIWDGIQEGLKRIFGVGFTVNPWERRGDWLNKLWFFPKGTGRENWQYQAMFHLSRKLDRPRLSFGLDIECPTLKDTQQMDIDQDRDGVRLIERLSEDSEFQAYLDELVHNQGWSLYFTPWDNHTSASSEGSKELLELLNHFPENGGWAVTLGRSMTPEEAIDLGDQVGNAIVAAYQELEMIWKRVIPEADRAFIEEQQNLTENTLNRKSEADARRVIEALLPDTESRRACLNLMADYIEAAHRHSPGTWELTLFEDRVRLNVGKMQTFVIYAGEIYVVLDDRVLNANDRTELEEHGTSPGQVYQVVADTYDLRVSAENLRAITSTVESAYPTLVERTAQTAKRSPWYTFHSPGVLAYLRDFLDRDIPDPDYGDQGLTAPTPALDLKATLQALVTARGLQYTSWQLATFYTALQTKGFVILSGISGTGKTKLAQAFAEALPAASDVLVDVPDDIITITIQPYMRKYNRMIIPKHALRLFIAPKRGSSKDVTVKFGDQQQTCRLTYSDYENTNYVCLYFRGELTPWFKETFSEGDVLGLQPELDDEGSAAGFRIYTESELAASVETESSSPSNLLFVPVRPDWRDSKSLLGYYNPLTGTYQWTAFLRFISRAAKSYRDRDGLAWFVILDEMNLAHVEYYFADLLSILESGRDSNGWTREPIRIEVPPDAEGDLPPRESRLPPNLYIMGTVNVDETTHTFSPKVLDRGFTLELTDIDLRRYPSAALTTNDGAITAGVRESLLQAFTQEGQFARIDKRMIFSYVEENPSLRRYLARLNDTLQPYDLHFGYRVFDEIVTFVALAQENDLYESSDGFDTALDAAVLMKVLPKFHGSRGKLEAPLIRFLAWCIEPEDPNPATIEEPLKQIESADEVIPALGGLRIRFPHAAAKATRMLWSLYASGFAAFS